MKKLLRYIFTRIMSTFSSGILLGSAVSILLFLIISLFLVLAGYDDMRGGIYLMTALCSLCIPFSALTFTARNKSFHRHDAQIIGSSFIGYSKKCRVFAEAMELFAARRYDLAVDVFMYIDENMSEKLDGGEKAVLCFYIGRCYHLMNYATNAWKYYNLSAESGFRRKVLRLLMARCAGEMGDLNNALKIYNDILADANDIYHVYVRTDLGRMYLKNNDAENALVWFSEAIDKHENYALALAGAALSNILLRRFDKGEELKKLAIVNGVPAPQEFESYFELLMKAETNSQGNEGEVKNV